MPGSGDDWPSRWAPPLTNAAKRRDNEKLKNVRSLLSLSGIETHTETPESKYNVDGWLL